VSRPHFSLARPLNCFQLHAACPMKKYLSDVHAFPDDPNRPDPPLPGSGPGLAFRSPGGLRMTDPSPTKKLSGLLGVH
jgi:hypothetical protein